MVKAMKALCPINIKFETLAYLESLLADCTRPTVVLCDRVTGNIWGLSQIIERKEKDGAMVWIDGITANPTQADICHALEKVGTFEPAQILAIGGGSALDLAKALSVFRYYFKGSRPTVEAVTEAIKSKAYLRADRVIDLVAVPSTSGTGSEVTCWATIWDQNKESKFSIEAPFLYPKQALIIPELTLSLPPLLTLSTALDALCHASEAFWAKESTPIVKDIACRAIDIIMGNLKQCLSAPNNIKHRKALARGSVLAGIAFSNTHTTACHSISYPITMGYGVMHGLACALTLEAVAQINRGAIEDADLLFEVYEKHGGLRHWLDEVCDGLVRLRLSSFNIPQDALDDIVKRTFTKGRMDNNPVDLTENQVYSILQSVY